TIAETWEVSDVEGHIATVREGELRGQSLRQLALEHPQEMMGRGWTGPHFPLLAKFLDGAGMLPVHLHGNDEAARRVYNEPNGKSEAWHILDAAPGATVLVGLLDGVDMETLREALLRQDYDAVMRRIPVRAGDTVYVPGGALHRFVRRCSVRTTSPSCGGSRCAPAPPSMCREEHCTASGRTR